MQPCQQVEEVEYLYLPQSCEPREQLLPAPRPGSRLGQAEQAEGGGDWRCWEAGDSDRTRDAERTLH